MTTETTGATGTQADPGTQPPAGTATTQAEGAEESQGDLTPPTETISPEELKKLRQEYASYRRRIRDLEAEKAKADEAQLSEQERMSRRLAEAERQLIDKDRELSETRLRLHVTEAARKQGFTDPGDALRLIDQAAMEFGDDGVPTNLYAQLQSLAKAKPYLLSAKAPVTGSGDLGLGGGQAGKPSYTREQLRDSTFFAKNKDDILAAQREGRITG